MGEGRADRVRGAGRLPVERGLVEARDRSFQRIVRVDERLANEFDCLHVISGSRRPAQEVPWTTDVRIVPDASLEASERAPGGTSPKRGGDGTRPRLTLLRDWKIVAGEEGPIDWEGIPPRRPRTGENQRKPVAATPPTSPTTSPVRNPEGAATASVGGAVG